MAWLNSGTWMGLRVDYLGYVMNELKAAITERAVIIPTATTPSWTGWVTPSGQPIQRTCGTNIPILRAAIEALIASGDFWWPDIVTGEYGQIVSLANCLDQGSYGSTWVTATRAQQAAVWLQLQEALNVLICVRWDLAVDEENAFSVADKYSLISWADAKGKASTGVYDGQHYGWSFGGGDTPWWDIVVPVGTETLKTSVCQGTLLKGIAIVNRTATANASTNIAVTFLDESIVTVPGVTENITIDAGTSWPNIGSDTSISFECSPDVPDTLPFTTPPASGGCGVNFVSAHCFTDISGLMTYG